MVSNKRKVLIYLYLIMIITFFIYPILAFAGSVSTYIPPQAFQYFPVIKKDTQRLLPGFKYTGYIPSLIEHESCIHLKHKRCWNPTSELKSSRELGIGLGQITKAYRTDGTVRFDALSEIRNRHMTELKELSWSNVRQRPDLQIRSIILMIKNNYNSLRIIPDPYNRLQMTLASYNGGLAGLNKERIACGLAKNCNPKYWHNNVETYCLKSKKPLYGNRSACDINRSYVSSIDKISFKYVPYFN